jgi:oxygen-dependent protoporphyrinogen oxidase
MQDTEHDVVIVGGGIAGLAAAWTLSARGLAVLLLEATDRWGGVIRTEVVSGFLLEAGPDAFIAQKPQAAALCRELGLFDRLLPSNTTQKTVFLLREGRTLPLPEGLALGVPTRLRAFLRSPLVSWPGKARMGLEPLLPRRRDTGDESVADFFRRRLGAEALRALGDPLLSAIHGGDAERLSMRAVLPRFADMERSGSLVLGLWRAARKAPPGGPTFYALQGGLSELVNALVTRLPHDRRRLSQAVSAVRCEDGGVSVESESGRLRARAVILALPPHRAARLLEPLDARTAEELSAIAVAPAVTVHLAYRRQDVEHPLDGHGLLVPRTEGLRCTACSFVSTKFPSRAPGGHVLLRAALGGTRDPDVVRMEERDLVRLAHAEMAKPLGLRADPLISRAYRWPSATPQMEVGHLERVARIERRLADLPGIHLTGGGFKGVGLPDVIGDARAVAARVADELDRTKETGGASTPPASNLA